MSRYGSIDFTTDFMASFACKDLSVKERRATLEALELLDKDERHSSLPLHALSGELSGQWFISASMELRITFYRRRKGRKELVGCSRLIQPADLIGAVFANPYAQDPNPLCHQSPLPRYFAQMFVEPDDARD